MGRRNRQRWIGWLGITAVLGNVLAGALCLGPARAAASVEEMFGAHLMCTGDATHTQVPGQVPGGGQEPDGKSAHCTLCTLLGGFALIVALTFAAIAFASAYILHPLRFDLTTLAEHLSLGGIRSRAPPLAA